MLEPVRQFHTKNLTIHFTLNYFHKKSSWALTLQSEEFCILQDTILIYCKNSKSQQLAQIDKDCKRSPDCKEQDNSLHNLIAVASR